MPDQRRAIAGGQADGPARSESMDVQQRADDENDAQCVSRREAEASAAAGTAAELVSRRLENLQILSDNVARVPRTSARLMIACPIDTSSRCGNWRNIVRLRRSRSCPALTPSADARAHAARPRHNGAKLADAAAGPRSKARANGSV